ncbi:MAG TPA: glutathionylspermidine synthase family protein, partial [Burkholderiales bacterium]|nr:glutathionylspermidine synthase family protein [Burkholderiales bacterium]
APLPEFDGNYPVIGSWVIGDAPAGIGIREDVTPVTSNTSRFIPHYFD